MASTASLFKLCMFCLDVVTASDYCHSLMNCLIIVQWTSNVGLGVLSRVALDSGLGSDRKLYWLEFVCVAPGTCGTLPKGIVKIPRPPCSKEKAFRRLSLSSKFSEDSRNIEWGPSYGLFWKPYFKWYCTRALRSGFHAD